MNKLTRITAMAKHISMLREDGSLEILSKLIKETSSE